MSERDHITFARCRAGMEELNILVVIPTYNNAPVLGAVLRDIRQYAPHVLVVNDGSTDETARVLEAYPDVRVIAYPHNRGKGHALKTGLRAATTEGYRYAITIDSDGQHFAADLPRFVEAIRQQPDRLLIGARNLASDNMPGKNTFANKFSNFWFRLETGLALADTQSGYRLYPLQRLKGMRFFTTKYEFELEIIVRAAWRNIPVANIPVGVYYPPEGERISHFRPVRDFTRISVLNSVLVTVALLWYWPWRFVRSLTRENVRRFIEDNITRSGESNLRITLSVMLGVFFGIAPLWGYQMIVAGVSAHFLRLNKVLAVVASNISIPPMIPFLLYGSYVTGGWMLGLPLTLDLHTVSFDALRTSLLQYLAGSVVFGLLCSGVAGVVLLPVLALFRKKTERKHE